MKNDTNIFINIIQRKIKWSFHLSLFLCYFYLKKIIIYEHFYIF